MFIQVSNIIINIFRYFCLCEKLLISLLTKKRKAIQNLIDLWTGKVMKKENSSMLSMRLIKMMH